MKTKTRKTEGSWGEYLPIMYSPPQSSNNQSKEKSKYRKGSKYDSWGRTHFGDTTWDSMSESQKDKYINDQKYYERIGQGLGKEYEDRKKAEKKAEIEKRIIEKQGGIEFVTAKKKHLVHTRKKQIKKWKEDERPEIIRSLTTRKKGKVGTSKVGNVIHSFLYPVKKRKKARW